MTDLAELRSLHPTAEAYCVRCWWREGWACYNERLLRAGGVNKMPRKSEGDDRNGMEITKNLWAACPTTSRYTPQEPS